MQDWSKWAQEFMGNKLQYENLLKILVLKERYRIVLKGKSDVESKSYLWEIGVYLTAN